MGFFDIFGGDDDDFERRERRRAKEEAADYRREAKNILSEAKDLYEDDYKELKGETQRRINKLNDLVRSYNRYKADCLQELGGDINDTIENFKRFNISSRVISMPNISSNFSSSMPNISASSFSSSIMPGGGLNLISLVLSSASDPYKDRDKALDQLYEARDYLAKVQDAIAELKIVYRSLESSRTYVEDEKTYLTQLMGKIRAIMPRLKNAMTQNSFTEKEASTLQGVLKIAELIKKTLETQLAEKGGDISANYKKYSQKIRDINKLIPAQPVIESSSGWVEKILQIEVY